MPNPLDQLDFSYLAKDQKSAPQPQGNPLDKIDMSYLAKQQQGPGMNIGTSFPMNNTMAGLKQGAQAFLAGGKEGLQQMGEGIKQSALQVGGKVGLTDPNSAANYTKQTNSEQAIREKQLQQKFPTRNFELQAGKFAAQNAPFALTPGGLGGGALKGLLAGAGMGLAAGGSQYSPDNSMTGKAITAGVGAAAGAAPGLLNKLGSNFVQKHADIIKDFQKQGVKPTLGQVLQTQSAQRVDSVISNIPGSGMQSRFAQQKDIMSNKAMGIMSKIESGLHTDTIKAIVNDPSATSQAIVNKLYENAQQHISALGGDVPLTQMGAAADSAIQNFSKFGSISPADQKIVDLMTKFKGMQTVSANDAIDFRNAISRAYTDLAKVPGGSKVMQSIRDGFDADLKSFAGQTNSTASAMLQTATQAFKSSKELELVKGAFDKAHVGDAFNITKFADNLTKMVVKNGKTLTPETKDALVGYAKMAGYLKTGLQREQRTGIMNMVEKGAESGAMLAAMHVATGHAMTAAALVPLSMIYKSSPQLLIAASKMTNTAQLGVQWAKIASRLSASGQQANVPPSAVPVQSK